MTPRRRTALVVVAPLVSVATLMLGLRVGAGSAVRAATVFAAPPGRALDGLRPFAWQLMTYVEDRGVRETIAVSDITVVARANGHEARWTGATNADGIAEATLNLPEATQVDVEIRAANEPQPLALGVVDVPPHVPRPSDRHPGVRPSRRDGTMPVDLFVEGGRLVVGFPTSLWVRVRGDQVELHAEPEAGLRLEKDVARSHCDGWAEFEAVAEGHVSGIDLVADDLRGHRGTWFGALPVAAGAFSVGIARSVPANAGATAVLVAPNPRTVVYAEVDDEEGRVFAAALPLAIDAEHPVPRAPLAIPPLASGLHWLVVSGEPRGAERLSGATIAKPFLVGDAPGVRTTEACSIGPWLAQRPPIEGFPRRLALDGMASRGASNRARHRAGLAIGLLSLLAAAVLEVILLTAAAREARAVTLLADLEEGDERLTAKPPGGGLTIAILVALLGFALLAALMVARA